MLVSLNEFLKMPIEIGRKEVNGVNRKKNSVEKVSGIERGQNN